MDYKYAKHGATTVALMGQGRIAEDLDNPRGNASSTGSGPMSQDGRMRARVYDGIPEPRGEAILAAPHPSSPNLAHGSALQHKASGAIWQMAPPPRRYRRVDRYDKDGRNLIVWGLSERANLQEIASKMSGLGLVVPVTEWQGQRMSRHLELVYEDDDSRQTALQQFKQLKFFNRGVNAAVGRRFRDRERVRRLIRIHLHGEAAVRKEEAATGYRVLPLHEECVDDVQVVSSELAADAPKCESECADVHVVPLHSAASAVGDQPAQAPAEGGSTRAEAKRSRRVRKRAKKHRSKQFDTCFKLLVASHNCQGKTGYDNVGTAEWASFYKHEGWLVIGAQEHRMGKKQLSKCSLDGFRIFGKPAEVSEKNRCKGGVLFAVANFLGPYCSLVSAPVDHRQQVWLRIASGVTGAQDIYVGNGYFPQETQKEESSEAYAAWQAAIAFFGAKGLVVTVADANAKLGPACSRKEEGIVGQHGEVDDKGAPVRSQNGKRLAAVLVATGLRNLSGFSCPVEGSYWWSRREQRGMGTGKHLLDYICASPGLASGAKFGAVWAELTWSGQRRPKRAAKPYRSFRVDKLIGAGVSGNDHAAKQALDYLRDKFDDVFQHCLQKLGVHQLPELDLSGGADSQRVVDDVTERVAQSFRMAAHRVLGSRCIRPRFTNNWFDGELKELIQQRREAYAAYRRDESNAEARLNWLRFRKQIRKATRAKKSASFKQVQEEAVKCQREQSSKRFWLLAKRLGGARRTKVSAPVQREDGSLACTLPEKVARWEEFRRNSVKPRENPASAAVVVECCAEAGSLEWEEAEAKRQFHWIDRFRDEVARAMKEHEVGEDTCEELDKPFTQEEVLARQRALNNHKACGEDKVKNEMLKYGGAYINGYLTQYFNWIREAERTPKAWGKGIIVNIPKGGDPTDPDNWRDISIISCLVTLFVDGPDKLRPEQGGFHPGRRTTDQVFTLCQRLKGRQQQKRESYVLFVDLRKAFPSVWRDGLFERLWKLGVRGKFWRTLRRCYEQTSSQVLVDGALTPEVLEGVGVQQGSPLSPTLFNVFTDELCDRLASALKITDVKPLNDIKALL
eukprot:g57197.t1